jgi:hypothetical protein
VGATETVAAEATEVPTVDQPEQPSRLFQAAMCDPISDSEAGFAMLSLAALRSSAESPGTATQCDDLGVGLEPTRPTIHEATKANRFDDYRGKTA